MPSCPPAVSPTRPTRAIIRAMERTAALCTRLHEQVLQGVRPFVDVTDPCILLDFPDHGNVGDR